MSTAEHEIPEGRSSVKVTRNAKGDAQWEIKVRVGDTREELDTARTLAVEAHQALERELLGPTVGAT